MLAFKVYLSLFALGLVLWAILPPPIKVVDDRSLFAECNRQSGGAYKDILFKQCIRRYRSSHQ